MTNKTAKETEAALKELLLAKEQIECLHGVNRALEISANLANTARKSAEEHIKELQDELERMENLYKNESERASLLDQDFVNLTIQHEEILDQLKKFQKSEIKARIEAEKEKGKTFHFYSVLQMLIEIADELALTAPENVVNKLRRWKNWNEMQMEFAEKMYGLKMID